MTVEVKHWWCPMFCGSVEYGLKGLPSGFAMQKSRLSRHWKTGSMSSPSLYMFRSIHTFSSRCLLLSAWKCSMCVAGCLADQPMEAETTRSFEMPARYVLNFLMAFIVN